MAELSRRKMLLTGGAIGAATAIGISTAARAQAAKPWSSQWDPEADPVSARLLDEGVVPQVNRLLWN